MSADTDAVTLAIAGHEHRDWERYSIDSDFFTAADAWSLSLGIPATAIPDYVKPWAEVQVRLGTDVILTGRVDAVRRRLAKGEHRLELHGRDRAGVLLDCSAPVLARRELTLAEICATYLRPLGIDRMDVQGGDSRKKVTVEPGMSAWEALERAAELAGLWPWFTPDGVLKVAAPDYGRAVDAELILDTTGTKNNVLDLSLEDNCQRRWSEVTVLGQGTGDEHEGAQPAIKAVARDAEAGFARPLIRDATHLETTAQAQARANKLLSDSIFESWQAVARGGAIARTAGPYGSRACISGSSPRPWAWTWTPCWPGVPCPVTARAAPSPPSTCGPGHCGCRTLPPRPNTNTAKRAATAAPATSAPDRP